MLTTTTVREAREAIRPARGAGRLIAFVPTMGALHAGHGRLIQEAHESGGFTAVSIFVNPTQFGPKEDFSRYPRTLDADLALCREAGADLVFAPDAAEIYPFGIESTSTVDVPGLTGLLEGRSRPTHFRGVTTVVMKLFQAIGPDIAWFGRKDYQQAAVIRRMAEDMLLPVEIRVAETVREPDGLAMSSRNRYLSPEERRGALSLSRALRRAEELVAGGETSADRVRQVLRETIELEPLARIDYAEVADRDTLQPRDRVGPGFPSVALVAVFFGTTRLIDNALLAG